MNFLVWRQGLRGPIASLDLLDPRQSGVTTETGITAAGDSVVPLPPPGPELVQFWKSKLSGVGPMLDVLAAHYPEWITRADLAAELGMAAGGGTFSTYISRLRSPGLVDVDGLGEA